MTLWNEGIPDMVAGRRQAAVSKWTSAMHLQEAYARKLGSSPGVRFLYGASWTAGVGHLALLDFFAKAKALGIATAEHIVLAPPHLIANRDYLDCWKPCLPIETREDVIRRHDRRLREDFPAVLNLGGRWMWLHDALHIVQSQWEKQGREPIISLPEHLVKRGWHVLERLGVPRGGWFVTVHVRDLGAASGSTDTDSVRNADITTYIDAINAIAKAGGWIFRVGQTGCAQLPELPNVFDYANSAGKAGWLDIFLLSEARFVVATNSGPAWVAGTFGTPALLTNWAPAGITSHYGNTLTMHQSLWSPREGRALSRDEQSAEPFGYLESEGALAKHGLVARRNSPDELAAAVQTMLSTYDETAGQI